MRRNYSIGYRRFSPSVIDRVTRKMLREADEQQQGLGGGLGNGQGLGGFGSGMDDDEMDGNDYELSQETADDAMGSADNGMEDDETSNAQPVSENGDADALVAQIRELCLQGLGVLANDIDDPAYDLFKKVWLMCDKAQTPDDNMQQQA